MTGESLVLEITKQLNRVGSWTGRTHIQKLMFLLKDKAVADVPFDFILHYYGPYSREVDQTIQFLLGVDALVATFPMPGYGAKYSVGSNVGLVRQIDKPEIQSQIDELVRMFGEMGVKDLERLSTTLFLARQGVTADELPDTLQRVKPHITSAEAISAISDLHRLGFDA